MVVLKILINIGDFNKNDVNYDVKIYVFSKA